ncbi:MAG: DUF4336 domain-containing protein [Rhodobacteraceae bacterium]|nr:DUF4336 domain-containing protein [Paracoccaceae bacterium]
MLTPYVSGQIWLAPYPVRYAGTHFDARMTVIRLPDGRLLLHSPGPIDAALRAEIAEIGTVAALVAPGSFHWLHLAAAQAAFPAAETHVCPGVERKAPGLAIDGILGDRAPPLWAGTLDQVLLRGSRFMCEVAFLHRPSRTLILTDLIENFTDRTPHAGLMLKLWFKGPFRMWNRPAPAPEYRLGIGDRAAFRHALDRILGWEFDRIVLSHGDTIDTNARAVAEAAWARYRR